MGNYFKVRGRFSGCVIIWDSGRLICEKEVERRIRHYAKRVSQSGCGVFLAGQFIASDNLLASMVPAYALINALEPMEIIEGDFPPLGTVLGEKT